MDNYKLLERYKNTISICFALFILITLRIIQWFFSFSIFYKENINLNNNLKSRYAWVENILKNKSSYLNQINENNFTTRLIVEKTLEWVTIYENNTKILWDINIEKLWSWLILNGSNYKFYQDTSIINWEIYKIVIKELNIYNLNKFIRNYLYFIIFSFPFLLFFYYIAYIFVWYNFRPIRETISSLESFSENINHELKTPLTEIISTLSLAQKIKTNYEDAIEKSLNSSKKINKILDSMLWIINIISFSYKKERLNLVNEINDILEENKEIIKEKNILLTSNFKNKNFYLNINKEHFDICVKNILENAIKYSNINWEINISCDNWTLVIKDNWIWIDEKNLKNIFNKYFRENYDEKNGYGLWLALVKKIADLNKWEVTIESKKNKWTIAKITFIKIQKWKK